MQSQSACPTNITTSPRLCCMCNLFACSPARPLAPDSQQCGLSDSAAKQQEAAASCRLRAPKTAVFAQHKGKQKLRRADALASAVAATTQRQQSHAVSQALQQHWEGSWSLQILWALPSQNQRNDRQYGNTRMDQSGVVTPSLSSFELLGSKCFFVFV